MVRKGLPALRELTCRLAGCLATNMAADTALYPRPISLSVPQIPRRRLHSGGACPRAAQATLLGLVQSLTVRVCAPDDPVSD